MSPLGSLDAMEIFEVDKYKLQKNQSKKPRKKDFVKAEMISPEDEVLFKKLPSDVAFAIKSMHLGRKEEQAKVEPMCLLKRPESETNKRLYDPDEISSEVEQSSMICEPSREGLAEVQGGYEPHAEEGGSVVSDDDFNFKTEGGDFGTHTTPKVGDDDGVQNLPKSIQKNRSKNRKIILNYKTVVEKDVQQESLDPVDMIDVELPIISINAISTDSAPILGQAEIGAESEDSENELLDVHAVSPPVDYPFDLQEEDVDVGEDGDLLVPDQISQHDFEAKWLRHASKPRPYVAVNICGVKKVYGLLDTGASCNTASIDLIQEVRAELAKEGHELPEASSELSLRCFGGRILANNSIVLLNLKLAPDVIVQNLPVLAVSDTGISRGLLLGSPFFDLTESALSYTMAGPCNLRLGISSTNEYVNIKARMVGNTHHVKALNSVEILPKQSKRIEAYFCMAEGIDTTLDHIPLLLEAEDLKVHLEEDQTQVVHAKEGSIFMTFTNKSPSPYLVVKNAYLGTVTTMDSIQSSIDLALTRSMVDSVEMSKVRLINCMCSDQIGPNVGLLIFLDRDDYSGFGPNFEKVSCWDAQPKYNRSTPRISYKGSMVFVRTNHDPKSREITQADIAIIQKRFPKSLIHTLYLPYSMGRIMSLPAMRTVQLLRESGYTVDIPCFAPEHPMKYGNDQNATICETCLQGTFLDIITDDARYKIPEIKMVFPTRYGKLPEGFGRKIKGSKLGLFKLWEWRITYFLHNINSMHFIVHLPEVYLLKGDQIKYHCALLLKYLKVGFPKAQLTISTMAVQNTHLLWVAPLEEALDLAKDYIDFYDASLGKPRRRKPKHEQEPVNYTQSNCPCPFCTPTLLDDNATLSEIQIYSAYWGHSREWTAKLKALQKQLKTCETEPGSVDADPCSFSPIEAVELIENLNGEAKEELFLDEIEYLNFVLNAKIECELDSRPCVEVDEINFHCQGAGGCAQKRYEVIDMNGEPMAPDPIQAGYDPALYFESKAEIENMSDYVDLTHLSADQQKYMLEVLEKHKSCLSISSDDVRFIRHHYLSFAVSDPTEWYLKVYPMSVAMTAEFMKHFQNLTRRGFARPESLQEGFSGSWFSPSFLVWKNSASKLEGLKEFRLVSDFSKANTLISGSFRGDAVPHLDQLLQCFASSRGSSVMDACNFFPSFRVSHSCQKYLGLSAPENQHNLLCITAPLGISKWPGLTQIASRCMLRDAVRARTSQFIDDFALNNSGERYPLKKHYENLIGSGEGLDINYFEHLSLLDDFLADADYFGILFSLKKAKLAVKRFEYLGYLFDDGKMIIPENKIKALEEFPIDDPKLTQKHLQGVLGLTNYLSQSICSYSAKSFLLYQKATEKLVSGQKFKLGDIHKKLLRELIEDCKHAPGRYVYNSSLPLDIFIDSSLTSMAAVMYNRDIASGRRYLIRFASWRHTDQDIYSLSSILKELATLIKVLRTFPIYFQNTEDHLITQVYTDQLTIRNLLINKQLDSPNQRISRWLTTIANLPLRFKFNWVPGNAPPLQVADFGSRDPRLVDVYISRFSNKLDKIPQHKRPIWRGECTTKDIRDYLKRFDLIKFPRTHKTRVPVQDDEADPMVLWRL